jgi:hypothetical protein
VLSGVCYRDPRTITKPEQVEGIQLQVVGDGRQIAHVGFERQVIDVTL